MNIKFKEGDSVVVRPLDGPLPAGIPYSGFRTKISATGDGMVSVKATNGFKFAILFDKEVELILEDGSDCYHEDCEGSIVIRQESCYCSATNNPPCSACEHSWLECDTCGDKVDD